MLTERDRTSEVLCLTRSTQPAHVIFRSHVSKARVTGEDGVSGALLCPLKRSELTT